MSTWLFGHDSLAGEVLSLIKQKNDNVVVISAEQTMTSQAENLNCRVFKDYSTLTREKPSRPDCVFLLFDDDHINLELALAIDRVFPDIPIIIRMFQIEIRGFVKFMLPYCEVVAASEIAAPTFAHLALYGNDKPLPKVVAHPEWGRENAPRKKLFSIAQKMNFYYDKKIGYLTLFFLFLLVGGTVILHELTNYSWFDALYHSMIISHGEMDIETDGSPVIAKVYVLGMFTGGVILLTMLYAVLTDFFVKIRLAKSLGEFPKPTGEFTLVCGLGKIGSRVIQELYEEGEVLVGIDHSDFSPGMQLAKKLQIHTQKGSITDHNLLSRINIKKAKTALVLSDSDMHNLECAMELKKLHPDIRIIIRLFDTDLAQRASRGGMVDASCSVSQLAAGAIVSEAEKITV